MKIWEETTRACLVEQCSVLPAAPVEGQQVIILVRFFYKPGLNILFAIVRCCPVSSTAACGVGGAEVSSVTQSAFSVLFPVLQTAGFGPVPTWRWW